VGIICKELFQRERAVGITMGLKGFPGWEFVWRCAHGKIEKGKL